MLARRLIPATLSSALVVLALGATPSLASTGTVFFDNVGNVGAGANLSTGRSPARTTRGSGTR
jgi:hypothetical protein